MHFDLPFSYRKYIWCWARAHTIYNHANENTPIDAQINTNFVLFMLLGVFHLYKWAINFPGRLAKCARGYCRNRTVCVLYSLHTTIPIEFIVFINLLIWIIEINLCIRRLFCLCMWIIDSLNRRSLKKKNWDCLPYARVHRDLVCVGCGQRPFSFQLVPRFFICIPFFMVLFFVVFCGSRLAERQMMATIL